MEHSVSRKQMTVALGPTWGVLLGRTYDIYNDSDAEFSDLWVVTKGVDGKFSGCTCAFSFNFVSRHDPMTFQTLKMHLIF